jgi:hypothetical protein
MRFHILQYEETYGSILFIGFMMDAAQEPDPRTEDSVIDEAHIELSNPPRPLKGRKALRAKSTESSCTAARSIYTLRYNEHRITMFAEVQHP